MNYTYEAIKIALSEEPDNAIMEPTKSETLRGKIYISATKVLKGIRKSYDKGKFLLEESLASTNPPLTSKLGMFPNQTETPSLFL